MTNRFPTFTITILAISFSGVWSIWAMARARKASGWGNTS